MRLARDRRRIGGKVAGVGTEAADIVSDAGRRVAKQVPGVRKRIGEERIKTDLCGIEVQVSVALISFRLRGLAEQRGCNDETEHIEGNGGLVVVGVRDEVGREHAEIICRLKSGSARHR